MNLPAISCFFICFCLIFYSESNSQKIRGFEILQSAAKKENKYQQITGSPGPLSVFDSAGNVNYIKPILILLANREIIIKEDGAKKYYDRLAAYLSFIGDYENALTSYDQTGFSFFASKELSKELIEKISGVKILPFVKFLSDVADSNSVVMINEAHHRPIHRMNASTILDLLYKKGYRTLAVEALANFPGQDYNPFIPGMYTGFYTAEPNMSELLRHAVKTGFKLLPYEIKMSQFSFNNRDSIQAINILDSIKPGPNNKLIVYAGYGHIDDGEDLLRETLATYFRVKSGIDPLTIDQTRFIEGNIKTVEVRTYDQLIKTTRIDKVGIPFYQGKPYLVLPQTDVALVFPKTTYKNARPGWLFNTGIKKEFRVEVPIKLKKNAFLIQAYYSEEARHQSLQKLIPADQTYDSDSSFFSLYLSPDKYTMVIRNIENEIIYSQEIEIK